MLFYDKRVVYLSYLEDDTKLKSAGYIRIEIKDQLFTMDMHVSVKGMAESGKYEIAAESGGETVPLGMIYLQNGEGSFRGKFPVEKIGRGEAGMPYDSIERFKIILGGNICIAGNLPFAEGKEKQTGQGAQPKVQTKEHPPIQPQMQSEWQFRAETKMQDQTPSMQQPQMGTEVQSGVQMEMQASQDKSRTFAHAHDEDVRKKLEEVRLTPDKWQQLLKNYKQIHPYGDERVYISIEPKDFVIMSEEYQHLAHNSFLLHGFYNYRHIILGEEPEKISGGEAFFLGVPGVFYEREKMVAMMFGFEAFECEGGKAENGKFGYYLKKIKI